MPRDIWFDGYVARLGWLDTFFPRWVYTAALIPAAAVAVLCLRALIARRATLRDRTGELAAYAAMTLGMMVLIGIVSYRAFPGQTIEYAQTRYFLPLLPLYGAVVALAARGAGRRWGPVVGTLGGPGQPPLPPPFSFQGNGTSTPPSQQGSGLANSSGNSGQVGTGDVAQLGNGQLNNVANPQAAGELNQALGPVVFNNLTNALQTLTGLTDTGDT